MRPCNGYQESGVLLKTQHRHRPVPDLLCLSHLRWNFIYQRPQQLMIRWARECRVFFVEEPVFVPMPQALPEEEQVADGRMVLRPQSGRMLVMTPYLPTGLSAERCVLAQRQMLERLMAGYRIEDYLLWYYTPMALPFTRHLEPRGVVYDCIDDLPSFGGPAQVVRENEVELLARADVVMTSGYSLYEAKRRMHNNIYPFPSGVDQAHFRRARRVRMDPPDQGGIPHPRLGFYGIIDERVDTELLTALSTARPDWHIVLVGPLQPAQRSLLLPHKNIHYLGNKPYDELPAYLSGWDVALLPFARTGTTRYISPTKTPEYLAAGKPVVSTSIHDVVFPYGELGLVRIADGVQDFAAAISRALAEDKQALLPRIDAMLAHNSWDPTWQRMKRIVEEAILQHP